MSTNSAPTGSINYLTKILGFPIEHILCISLEECVSRREHISVQAQKFGFPIEFVIVKKDPVPYRGCAESHLKCVQIAKDRQLDYVCILEDDCLFLEERMEEAVKRDPPQLPSDWEIIFLGYNSLRAYLYSAHLMKLIVSLTAHAYIIRSKVYDEILKGFRTQWWNIPEIYDIEPYDQNFLYSRELIDVFYAKYICHRRGESYGIYPMLATQLPGMSSIQNIFSDYTKDLEDNILRFVDAPVPTKEFTFFNPYSINDLISLPVRTNGKLELPNFAKKVMLDVGLSINAPHSHLWLTENPNDLLVFGFEPNPDAVEQIKGLKPYENKWAYHIDPSLVGNKLIVINCALGNDVRMVKLYVTEPDSGASSLYKPRMKVKKLEHVPQFKLKDFFDLFPFDQVPFIDYIKIDSQGSDLNVLFGAETYLKERVVYVTCNPDCSTVTKKSDLNSIINYMGSNGFFKIQHPNCVDPTFVNMKFLTESRITYICQIG